MDGRFTDERLAARLRGLRAERAWSLDELARASGVSRATLSRLEHAEVSPTASVLNRLCAAFGLSMSRLMALVEEAGTPLVRRDQQPLWSDAEAGFERLSVSPPGSGLAAEVVEGRLRAGARIAYERTPRPGLEHHLVMLEGSLAVTIEGETHRLGAGDCLRYRLFGPSVFETPAGAGARYLLFLV
ncbi:helix-turn-helix domain-containing protein [Enterovirga rhinocerotis]|nr:XRE family transcriptional regulator [Enterovirga rhinocerotis]